MFHSLFFFWLTSSFHILKKSINLQVQEPFLGPIHTGCGTRCTTRRKQMGPVDVNGGIHTAHKQHQRKNVPICVRVVSRVLCGLGLTSFEEDKSTHLWVPKAATGE